MALISVRVFPARQALADSPRSPKDRQMTRARCPRAVARAIAPAARQTKSPACALTTSIGPPAARGWAAPEPDAPEAVLTSASAMASLPAVVSILSIRLLTIKDSDARRDSRPRRGGQPVRCRPGGRRMAYLQDLGVPTPVCDATLRWLGTLRDAGR